ncbi:excinuclease ABC subunit UvrB [Candidatus Dependentiae bacterium]|nr:excinuclease ABC subunit UvrB [Candidatus Dependentiae bacterium]MBU4387252.1 excinuclease ABC subunit UvrB [Candidatus Dependentiae bacterium]MCG2756545.1 excinuclease ABC subunit UvrB [Candidatus Dependentiae bacterium]
MKNLKNIVFKLKSPFLPTGSQPEAIEKLKTHRPGKSTLLGVTGSGKTFTLANVIANQSKQVIILSPNKTLAAQLYEEFSLFFPENKVCYFVSYYDYYQPESYLPAQDIYIPKETKINDEIERLRVEATASIINRQDTIIIASVSAIYSLGNPIDYRELTFKININDKITRKNLIDKLIFIQYKRNDYDKKSGTFSVSGNTILVDIPYDRHNLRIELFGDKIDVLELIDKKNNTVVKSLDNFLIFPAKHFVTTKEKLDNAISRIKIDLDIESSKIENPVYRERLITRVNHDIEMLQETGFCSGIENYSRYFDGRLPGERPSCLFDFFDKDFLLIIDESHIAIPQLTGMYKGDKARKKALVDFGFRLQSSYDNRPLKFEEIESYFKDVIYVSATPSNYELKNSDIIAEQIVRPTGILDPKIEVISRVGQLDNLVEQIRNTTKNGFRTLVTVLTKKMAEELAKYLEKEKIKVCYMHADIKTPQRTELLHKLRSGVFDCLVGINLLREGLDLPEVALVAIMDADMQGFLRNTRSLIQTIGRAARNIESKVIFYADKITDSMREAIMETERRRILQDKYNKEHGIIPETVEREVTKSISNLQQRISDASKLNKSKKDKISKDEKAIIVLIKQLEKDMQLAAENLDFEKAIELRDKILKLREAK